MAGFDLIFPSVGELAGGSIRESNLKILQAKTKELGWYLDLRRFGYAPSGGFGLGLERLIMFISGTENIQNVVGFPILNQHLEF